MANYVSYSLKQNYTRNENSDNFFYFTYSINEAIQNQGNNNNFKGELPKKKTLSK